MSNSASHHFALFAVLWAAALVSHQIDYGDTTASLADAALLGSVVLVAFNPYSAWRLLAAAASHVIAVVYYLPEAFNHWYFAGIQSLAYAVIAATVFVRHRRLELDQVFPPFSAVARLNLLCLYYISAFHKLNSGYLSLEASCGGYMYGKVLKSLPFLPASGAVNIAAAYLGIAIEFTLPTLLLMRRSRRLAVTLGLIFHLCLGLVGYRRFSMIAYALLALFLTEVPALQPIMDRLRKRQWPILLAVLFVGIILWISPGHVRAVRVKLGILAGQMTPYLFLAATVLLLLVSTVALYRYRFAKAPPIPILPGEKTGLLSTALLILCGLSPYLGLQTLNTFAMYSNLRTEGGLSNHFLMPAGLQLFSYQRDLVQVEETNIQSLHRQGAVGTGGLLIPYQQLRVEVTREMRAGRKDIRLAFRRQGRLISTTHAEQEPELGVPVDAIAYKFLTFRAVEKSGGRGCSY